METRRSDSRLHRGRKLDVSLRSDPRNFGYGAAFPTQLVRKSIKWPCAVRLDQGREGACVGYGRAHGYACAPEAQLTTNRIAQFFYEGAKENDHLPGEDYEGTTPNGLYTFLRKLGLIRSFYQIRTIEELFAALTRGSVDLAALWREGCFEPDAGGFIHYQGRVMGGHFVEINGVDYASEYFWVVQSWGRHHGIDGEVKITFEDMRQMLRQGALLFWVEENTLSGLKLKKPKPRLSKWWQFWK